MAKSFYVTTPIYYVNDKPHIGHAYTTIACDVISRYMRLKGYDVKFLTGTDEHGQKIERAANSQGKTPQQLVDEIHVKFKDLWQVLNISNDDFIRTTEERHIKTVQKIFAKLLSQGDIYKSKYEGLYCVSCENYVSESNMGENQTCPDCGSKLISMQEESYFFRASKYVPDLIKYYENNPNAIKPVTRYNEIMSFLRGGVKDISVSRTSLKWGIPVPGDEKHVIYVWFDALINYLSALEGEDYKKFWPGYHVVGKDIIRFHCVTWPLMLIALSEKLPAGIIAHGWWTIKGGKMSKSKGNVIDPLDMINKYGLDPFRYFLMREIPFGADGEFSEEALIGRINSDLANDLGNLLNRTLQMIKNYRAGIVPSCNESNSPLRELAQEIISKVDNFMKDFAFDNALKTIWEFISRSNKFIDETTPWILAKNNESERLNYVLLNLYEALRLCAVLLFPFMPETSEKICSQLGCELEISDWYAGAGNKINKGDILFPRIDLKQEKKEQEKMSDNPEVKPESKESELITIEDFAKVQMRVGQITSCEEIPRSKKLYKLSIDLGSETRTVCSGIKEYFTPDELTGQKIILVCNLKPVKLCGVESNGMILAASVKSEGKLTLLTPLDENIPLGSVVS